MGPRGSDFLAFWGAARAVLEGVPQAAYELQWQESTQTGAGSGEWYAFVNPPPFLFAATRSEEHTSELQSLMRISYAVFCLTKNTTKTTPRHTQRLHSHK